MVRAELRQRAEALAELEQQLAARQAGTAARQAGTAATTTGQRRTAAGGTPAQPAPQAGAPATTLQRLTTAGGALAGRFAAVITGAGRWGWGWRSGGGPAPAQHQTLAQPASDAATVVAGGQEASQRGQVVPWAGGGGMARAGRPLPPATIIRAVLVVVAEGARAVRESVAAIGSPPVLPLERDATLTTTVPALRAHRAHYERLLGAAQMALMRLQAQNMLLQEASQTAGQEAAWLKRQLQAQQKRTQQGAGPARTRTPARSTLSPLAPLPAAPLRAASAVHAQLEVYVARVAELERLLQQLQGRQADEADKAAEATRQATEALHENIDALKSQLQEQETSMSAAMFALKQSAVQAEKEAKEAEKEARRSEREALEQAAAAQQRAQGAEQQAQDAKQRARAAEQRNTRVAEQAAELRAARKELEQQLRRVLQEGQQRVATTAERQQAAEREAEAAKQALKVRLPRTCPTCHRPCTPGHPRRRCSSSWQRSRPRPKPRCNGHARPVRRVRRKQRPHLKRSCGGTRPTQRSCGARLRSCRNAHVLQSRRLCRNGGVWRLCGGRARRRARGSVHSLRRPCRQRKRRRRSWTGRMQRRSLCMPSWDNRTCS